MQIGHLDNILELVLASVFRIVKSLRNEEHYIKKKSFYCFLNQW
jgi:hypothetical protein